MSTYRLAASLTSTACSHFSRWLRRKYKVLEDKTFRKRQAMEEKIPDIKKTLAMVEYLQVKKVSMQCHASEGEC